MNKEGDTPLMVARKEGLQDIVDILEGKVSEIGGTGIGCCIGCEVTRGAVIYKHREDCLTTIKYDRQIVCVLALIWIFSKY